MDEIRYGKLTLKLDDDHYVVSDCEKDAVEIVIPLTVDGVYVTEIGEEAFKGCELLETVTVEMPTAEDVYDNDGGLQKIGEYAFSDCTALTGITLPFSIRNIDRGAFYNCSSLFEVNYPEFVGAFLFIGPYAFAHCTMLTRVPPIDGNILEGMFSHCASLHEVSFGSFVKVISEDAFEHCDSLTKITIPASVGVIEGMAFRGCKRLRSVKFLNTEGWSVYDSYHDAYRPINVSDPARNARSLAGADFDDGVGGWYCM